jgi:selenocysteine lyase/cysteine desulfurase
MEVLLGQESGIVVFSHPRKEPGEVKSGLAEQGINVSVSSRHFEEPAQAVRASVHYYNSEAEIRQLADALRGLVTSH